MPWTIYCPCPISGCTVTCTAQMILWRRGSEMANRFLAGWSPIHAAIPRREKIQPSGKRSSSTCQIGIRGWVRLRYLLALRTIRDEQARRHPLHAACTLPAFADASPEHCVHVAGSSRAEVHVDMGRTVPGTDASSMRCATSLPSPPRAKEGHRKVQDNERPMTTCHIASSAIPSNGSQDAILIH